MEIKHQTTLDNDWREVFDLRTRVTIFFKLFVYEILRIVQEIILKSKVGSLFNVGVNQFLKDEGGMFKVYVYKLCNKLYPLRGSQIIVPGVGYGRNLFQLAAFRPKRIVGFDLYEYKEEWKYMADKIYKTFGTEVIFRKGGFESVADLENNSFDFVISDAVLEHVGDMDFFMRESKRLLRESGVFYASFGPLWYGPRGDHLNWGPTGMFNHLIGEEKGYEEGLKTFEKSGEGDSIEGVFLVKNKIFSYLKIEEYFNSFVRSGFKPIKILAKISSEALNFSSLEYISKRLDNKLVPKPDRICGGFLVWLRPNK